MTKRRLGEANFFKESLGVGKSFGVAPACRPYGPDWHITSRGQTPCNAGSATRPKGSAMDSLRNRVCGVALYCAREHEAPASRQSCDVHYLNSAAYFGNDHSPRLRFFSSIIISKRSSKCLRGKDRLRLKGRRLMDNDSVLCRWRQMVPDSSFWVFAATVSGKVRLSSRIRIISPSGCYTLRPTAAKAVITFCILARSM